MNLNIYQGTYKGINYYILIDINKYEVNSKLFSSQEDVEKYIDKIIIRKKKLERLNLVKTI